MEFFSYENARKALAEVIAERGDDFVYQRENPDHCTYVHTEGPDGYVAGCVWGAALNKMGASLGTLKIQDSESGNAVSDVITSLQDGFENTMLLMAADHVQTIQDGGGRYRHLLPAFDQKYAELLEMSE